MLDEILEKKQNEKTLPPSHSKYVTHQTTFGRVRVDLPSKNPQRQMVESLYKTYDPNNDEYRQFDERIWSMVDEDTDLKEHDIDFYGLINAHYRNQTFEKQLTSETKPIEDNYIDQLAFPELTTKKPEIKSKPLEKQTIEELKNEQMNYVDEQYFHTLKNIEAQEKIAASTTKRVEMPPTEELNYIDQLVFSSPNQTKQQQQQQIPPSQPADPKKLMDFNFKHRISEPKPPSTKSTTSDLNESPMDTYNPKLETMRSIKSKDYFDPPKQSAFDIQTDIETDKTASKAAEQIREQLTKKTSVRDSLGYRTFESLVPKWSTMTRAEIVDILIKQICFSRRTKYILF